MVTPDFVGENRTRPYAVYISDGDGNSRGSGVLYYPGGEDVFVFTCAHVVYDCESVRLFLLKPIDVAKDDYEPFEVPVSGDQVWWPSSYVPIEEGGEASCDNDYAIIRVPRPDGFDIAPTNYRMADAVRNDRIYTLGFPGGLQEGGALAYALDLSKGLVSASVSDSGRFLIRMEDVYANQADREDEYRGLSGGAVWDACDEDQADTLFGLVSAGFGPNARLSRLFAVRSSKLRQRMHDKFGIAIPRKSSSEDDENEPDIDLGMVGYSVHPKARRNTQDDEWLEEVTSECRDHILGLKLLNGIRIAKEAIEDERFDGCDPELQKTLMQCLLYCYEIGDIDEEFDALEDEMRRRGLVEKYDVLRHVIRSFSRKEYIDYRRCPGIPR